MSSEYQQWQDVKENYLKLIEKNLAQVDHPQRSEILANVREHLDSKYAELSPEQKNWEGYQQIITEMGPPEEYAELLGEDNTQKVKTAPGINTFLAILFVIVLAAVGSYLVYEAKQSPQPTTPAEKHTFEPDPQVLGKWVTIDFVETIEEFNPSQRSWQGRLFLESLHFKEQGEIEWCLGGGYRVSEKHGWTKGALNPDKPFPAKYTLDKTRGQYMFFEWISNDVIVRGQKPWYYILKKEE
jgi:hypothetical protein